MKAIVGVDLGEMYKPALDLVLRLEFPSPELLLVHAVEPIPQTMAPMAPVALNVGEWMEEIREAGERALASACEAATPRAAACSTRIIDGSAAHVLMAQADDERADLIAAGSLRQDRLTTMLFGSVARALATGSHQSVLLTKQEGIGTGPIHAVLATDHSPYADRCVGQLLAWKPNGIGKITVATAVREEEQIQEALTKNRGIAERLSASGIEANARAKVGGANDVIRWAMSESRSELLILGAQGHGFIERLFIGSTALHQVMNEAYSVFIIRA